MNTRLLNDFRRAITEGNGLRWRAAEIAFEYGVGEHTPDAAKELAEAGGVSISTVENLARAQRLYVLLRDEFMRQEDANKIDRLNACRNRLSYTYFSLAGNWVKAKSPPAEDVLSALEDAGKQGSFASLMRDLMIPDDVPLWRYRLDKVLRVLDNYYFVADLPEEYRKVILSFTNTMRGWYEDKM